MSAVASLAIFLTAFGLIAAEKLGKVKVVLIAAGLMAALGLTPGTEVFFSDHAGIDWNVIFLLFGMMVIVGVIQQTGLFDFLGIWAAKASGGRPYPLMVLLMVITAIASPFLDNVTTIMLIAPITLVVCERLRIAPQPYLIAEALASNIGGAATLIGDPPNIIIGTRAGLDFVDFVVHLTPITAIVFAGFVLFTRVLFRRSFEYHPERVAEVMAMRERDAITDTRLLVRALAVLALVIAAFSLHGVLHLEPSIVALLGAGVMVLISPRSPVESLHAVEWRTLVFFAGLFVMVSALVHTGVIDAIGRWTIGVVGHDYFGAATALLFGSAVIGAFFDNIPYVATMTPVVEELVGQVSDPDAAQAIWWSFALGADFGGNGTAIAASANVVVLGLAARAGHPISFWQFTRYGIVVTALSVLTAWGYVWLRYFAF
ncbi:ArsB/NhaD family transporter [Actinocatenispora sera]|uniref:Membrane protein n=1 Tax=Actinocatenispora sera TaxID=390989 RepID=A0A810LBH3_9ACTN|nr:ArsB/NhaD family transporter [Actinocatenispora sera]BCJ31616.1 membrane protein [Actinocatenispora sera]